MAQRIERDGKFYRMRRGELVEIPSQWVGQTTTAQNIRKRRSKLSHGERSEQSHPGRDGTFFKKEYRKYKRDGDI